MLVLAVIASTAAWFGWSAHEQTRELSLELQRRQQTTSDQTAEARLLAKQSQDVTKDVAAKVTLLEARLADTSLQRGQLEELIQSLTRSRDENLTNDIEASIRVAMQQTSLTGSAEPLLNALRSADERLARVAQPHLEGVRRALARDIDRVRAVGVPDISSLLIKLDEAIRLTDDLPLLSNANRAAERAAPPASATSAAAPASLWQRWRDDWTLPLAVVWDGVSSLLRVTRIDRPEAMLMSPEQGYFLRENLKLRLLNARLALLSRQPEVAQVDLQSAQQSLQRYFDPSARRTQVAQDLLRQVATQARQVGVPPRPDETLAAIAASVAGR